jgi:type II secretion system protein N
MAFLKKLKWLGYIVYFFCVFLIMLYLTFPADTLKGYVAQQVEQALGAGQNGQWVYPPLVRIGKVSLWRISGLSMRDVFIQPSSFTDEPAERWKFDQLKMRIGIFSTLGGKPQINFDSYLYDGRARGSVTLTADGGISQFWFDVNHFDLKQFVNASKGAALPMKGIVNMDAQFNLGKNPATEGDGEMNLDLKNFAVGPGKLELPIPGMAGGLSVPQINFGQFAGNVSLQKGKGKTKNLRLSGGDLEVNLNLEVDMHKNLLRSRLGGGGWFRIAPKFLNANPQFKAMLDFSPELKKAQEADGKYPFSLKGTLGMPFPKFGK